MKDSPSSQRNLDILRVTGVVVFFGLLFYALHHPDVKHHLLDVTELRRELGQGDSLAERAASSAVFLVAGTALVAVGFPRLWLSAIGGSVYGAALGSVLSLAASVAGSVITWMLAKSVLSGVAKRRLPKLIDRWRARVGAEPLYWVITLRLLPIANNTVANLMFGALRCPLGPFVVGSIIGFLPLTITFAMFGSGAAKQNPLQLIFAAILLIGTQVVYWRQRRSNKIAEDPAGELQAEASAVK